MKSVCSSRNSAYRFIDRVCNNLGDSWEVPQLCSVVRYKPPRTCEQNALMHVLWREIALQVGRTESEVKDIFKSEYGPEEVVTINDISIRRPLSTADYTKWQCSDMIDHIHMKAAEWGIEFES